MRSVQASTGGGLNGALLLCNQPEHIGNFVSRFLCCLPVFNRDFLGDSQQNIRQGKQLGNRKLS